jgi:hypothetical protein
MPLPSSEFFSGFSAGAPDDLLLRVAEQLPFIVFAASSSTNAFASRQKGLPKPVDYKNQGDSSLRSK